VEKLNIATRISVRWQCLGLSSEYRETHHVEYRVLVNAIRPSEASVSSYKQPHCVAHASFSSADGLASELPIASAYLGFAKGAASNTQLQM